MVWVPLEFLLDPDNRADGVKYKGEDPHALLYVRGRCIWGLSLMMLDELMDLVRARIPGGHAGGVSGLRAGRPWYRASTAARPGPRDWRPSRACTSRFTRHVIRQQVQ